MTYVYPKTRFYSVPTWWKPLSVFSFLEWVFIYKTYELKFSFDRIPEKNILIINRLKINKNKNDKGDISELVLIYGS